MSRDQTSSAAGAIWQGFHHTWEYNHRLNRLGSYVRSEAEPGDQRRIAGHTAASGTGGDVAHFAEYVTVVEAAGVAFQQGWAETTIECPRAVTTPFNIRVDEVPLAPELAGKDTYTVLINGFDLSARRHADKLIAFDVEVTEPTVYGGGAKLRFNVLGELCVDCRTAECQLWPLSLEVEEVRRRGRRDTTELPSSSPPPRRGIPKRPALEQGVNWLKRQIARLTDLETIKRGIVGRDEDRLRRRLFRLFGRQFFLRMLKWRIVTPYVLHVHYLIIGGDDDVLHVTDSDFVEHSYSWDAETEIREEDLGSRSVAVTGDAPSRYALNTFGFKRLSLTTEMDHAFGSSNPIQWGKGMHLLEWNAAIRDIEPADDRVRATLDLFYKSWSEAMNEVITFTTWGAVRSAGSATLGARLALLQLKEAVASEQRVLPGRIRWPGGGLSARDDPRARHERPVDGG
ncbi:MAG: hypothetical protein PVJ55_03390 [Anaerolineae bacterium]|jgi:hypothetical protein